MFYKGLDNGTGYKSKTKTTNLKTNAQDRERP